MPLEIDTPPPPNTVRYAVWQTVVGLSYLRAYWGRRLVGVCFGLMSDLLAEGASQAVYARLPGHPEQAPDSLAQCGADRGLIRFRGETDANWLARVQSAWADYAQAGTPPQVLRVVNQWGAAGWPASWVSLGPSELVESGSPTDFSFTLTIPYGSIVPPWTPWRVGDPGIVIGATDLFVGIGPSTDIPMLLATVKKWKRSASKAFVRVYYSPTGSVTFTVGQGGY